MTDPTPLTDDELARIRSSDPRVADRGRLLATVDRWREAHNQVATERDALRAAMRTALNPDTKINDAWRLLAEHVGWHDAPVSGTPGEHADGEPDYPLIDWRKANREQWERGTPGEDIAPAEPVCPTCNGEGGRYHRNSRGDIDGPWYPCPDCRPVGDQPGDTGNPAEERVKDLMQALMDSVAEAARNRLPGDTGTREVTKRDRAIAVKREIINSTSPITFTPGMKAALNRRDRDTGDQQ